MLLKSGIYMISNKINKKKYIGQSVNLKRRHKDFGFSFPENKEELEILPVECVSYFDCLYFCNKLSIMLFIEDTKEYDKLNTWIE